MDKYRVMTNPDLIAYKLFHDKEWMKDVMQSSVGTKLETPLFILNMVWFTYSHMFSLPSTFMQITKGISNGQDDARGQGLRYMFNALRFKFCQSNEFGLTVTKRDEIAADFARIEKDMRKVIEDNSGKLNEDEVFAGSVEVDSYGFGSGLAALIQQSFCGIYFAYDDFVKRCFWTLGGDTEIYSSSSKFYAQLKEKLQEDAVYEECWTCDQVKLAKEARSLVAHSSGIYKDDHPEYDDYYVLDKSVKRLLIHADGVKQLYANLKSRAEKLSRHVLGMI